jgi:signal transduction histidine kinase
MEKFPDDPSELLAKIIHELRSPLASILGYAELLSEPTYRDNTEFLQECQKTILKQAHMMDQFLENLLTMVAIQGGVTEWHRDSFHLGQLVEELVRKQRGLTEREIRYENRVGSTAVKADSFRLRKAITLLMDNGLKFSPQDQPVEVTVGYSEQPGWAQIAIRDYGVGIAAREMDQLFTPFGKIKSKQTRGAQGAGLGLYIAKQIVQQNGGHIEVQSKPGEGSTFTIELPVDQGVEANGHGEHG